jgi:8-oxo-dGTP diphosphatase
MALWHLGDNFTSDIVVISGEKAQRKLLLIRRKHEPFKDCWALPGGFVNSLTPAGEAFVFAESHLQAAQRELMEETGVCVAETDLQLIATYDAWGRDPRAEGDQRVVTQAFLVVLPEKPMIEAGDDAADARWFTLSSVLNGEIALAFDHADMVKAASELVAQTS